mmetsp:Transcript_54166/g.126045  ORF Transcript_54166/g.126045 Transcript_54166/m.126045 type:complete len:575 (+) Transcript_54166:59-1783(+)
MEVDYGYFFLSNYHQVLPEDERTPRSAACEGVEPSAAEVVSAVSEYVPAPMSIASESKPAPMNMASDSLAAPMSAASDSKPLPVAVPAAHAAVALNAAQPALAAPVVSPSMALLPPSRSKEDAKTEASAQQCVAASRCAANSVPAQSTEEPPLAPANPLPLPASRFFASSSTRLPRPAAVSTRLPAVPRLSVSTAPPRPSPVLPPPLLKLPGSGPPASTCPAPPPPTTTLPSSSAPPTHTQGPVGPATNDSSTPPRMESPPVTPKGAPQELVPTGVPQPALLILSPTTPLDRQSSCSTDTSSGRVRLVEAPPIRASAEAPEKAELSTALSAAVEPVLATEEEPPPGLPESEVSPGRAGSSGMSSTSSNARLVQEPEEPVRMVVLPSADADCTSHVLSSLDQLFCDEQMWQRIILEVSGMRAALRAAGLTDAEGRKQLVKKISSEVEIDAYKFRVVVPKPYPGVQYRKSKRLDDRYPRFAEQGSVVEGFVEDDGEWLRTNGHGYLPMRVGGSPVLLPLEPDTMRRRSTLKGEGWSCCEMPKVEPQMVLEQEFENNNKHGGENQPNPYKKIVSSSS